MKIKNSSAPKGKRIPANMRPETKKILDALEQRELGQWIEVELSTVDEARKTRHRLRTGALKREYEENAVGMFQSGRSVHIVRYRRLEGSE